MLQDDFSRKVWIYDLKIKAYVLNTFKQSRVMDERKLEK